MTRIDFSVRGTRAVAAGLALVSRRGREFVDDAVRVTADEVEQNATSRAPVDEGTLEGDIDVHPAEPDGSIRAWNVGIAAHDESAEYAPIVHFGDPGTRTGNKRRANPFLFNAMEEERGPHSDRIADAIFDALRLSRSGP